MALYQSVFVLVACSLLQTTWSQDNLRIIGGHSVAIRDVPYMAGIFEDGQLVCGGSIIHTQFILTAASCVIGYSNDKVQVGSARLRPSSAFDIEEEFCHEDYNPDTYDNDICLVKLKTPVTYGPRIAKVKLASGDLVITNGTLVNITGWGSTRSTGGKYPKHLKQTAVLVRPNEYCRRIYSDMTDTMICAGSTGHDACDGDGGGPLTYKNILIGVMSSLEEGNCGNTPAFYTKVSDFRMWIENTININS